MAIKQDESLGLENGEEFYIINTHGASRWVEKQAYQSTARLIARDFATVPGVHGGKADIKFINYGETELVYVLDYGDKQFTLLMGQPTVKEEQIKKECALLEKYAKISKNTVVAPIKYYHIVSTPKNPLPNGKFLFHRYGFITPYFKQADCVASTVHGYGVYSPDPFYRFLQFEYAENHMLCACMIAKLIELYDSKTQRGIAACRLGEGDFILEKGWLSQNITLFKLFNHMKLTAARDEVECSLEDYIKLIRKEFGKATYNEQTGKRDGKVQINHKNRCAMPEAAIESGIALGLRVRKDKGLPVTSLNAGGKPAGEGK